MQSEQLYSDLPKLVIDNPLYIESVATEKSQFFATLTHACFYISISLVLFASPHQYTFSNILYNQHQFMNQGKPKDSISRREKFHKP